MTNWAAHDIALRQRGSLTVWFTEAAIAAWKAKPRATRGGQPRYSALAITTALTLRAVFHLALRQGFAALAALPWDTKERLFAWCIASCLKPQLASEDRADPVIESPAGRRLGIPFADYWRPTAANYWRWVKKAHGLAIGRDILGDRWALAGASVSGASTLGIWRWCIPTGSAPGQARDIVAKFLRENPAQRHLAAASIVALALQRAWPCRP